MTNSDDLLREEWGPSKYEVEKERAIKIRNGEFIMMELKDTVDLMLSTDYKERFKAEYYQLKIRTKTKSKRVHWAKRSSALPQSYCW